jgi:hypothetical protein
MSSEEVASVPGIEASFLYGYTGTLTMEDRSLLVGGKIKSSGSLSSRPGIEASLLYTGTLRMTEKSLLVGGRTRSSGSLSSGLGIEASPLYSVQIP